MNGDDLIRMAVLIATGRSFDESGFADADEHREQWARLTAQVDDIIARGNVLDLGDGGDS